MNRPFHTLEINMESLIGKYMDFGLVSVELPLPILSTFSRHTTSKKVILKSCVLLSLKTPYISFKDIYIHNKFHKKEEKMNHRLNQTRKNIEPQEKIVYCVYRQLIYVEQFLINTLFCFSL
uniref:Uncharacterized protein n=1 Tax=Cacopsylla melanoneura TaxID=428564 RepID=A0A8D9ATH5_9HEMI